MKFTELEDKIFKLLKDTIYFLGFNLVLVSFKNGILSLVVEKDQGYVRVKDCKMISNNVSQILDVEKILTEVSYTLEVQSAGAERPLVTKNDYERFLGSNISIELYSPLNQKKKYQGKLVNTDEGSIFIKINDTTQKFSKNSLRKAKEKDVLCKEVIIPFELIKCANLVFTEEKFRALLKGVSTSVSQ